MASLAGGSGTYSFFEWLSSGFQAFTPPFFKGGVTQPHLRFRTITFKCCFIGDGHKQWNTSDTPENIKLFTKFTCVFLNLCGYYNLGEYIIFALGAIVFYWLQWINIYPSEPFSSVSTFLLFDRDILQVDVSSKQLFNLLLIIMGLVWHVVPPKLVWEVFYQFDVPAFLSVFWVRLLCSMQLCCHFWHLRLSLFHHFPPWPD